MGKEQTTKDLSSVNEKSENLTLQNAKATAADLIADFSSVDTSVLQGLTQEYLQLKEKTTYNMVFTGMSSFKGDKGGEVEAVLLVDQKGNSFINGNTVLVNSLRKVTMLPCLVRIVTGELVKSGSGTGKYMDMEVFVIPNAIKKPE